MWNPPFNQIGLTVTHDAYGYSWDYIGNGNDTSPQGDIVDNYVERYLSGAKYVYCERLLIRPYFG